MDEEPEQDSGYVTLVNAKYDEDGNLVEAGNEHTGIWAWKHPHHDGTLTYTELKGDVRFFDVDFGYTPRRSEDIFKRWHYLGEKRRYYRG